MISVKTLWQNQVTFGKCLVKKNATLNLETQALYIAGNGASRSRFVESLPPHQAVLMFAHDGDPCLHLRRARKVRRVASSFGWWAVNYIIHRLRSQTSLRLAFVQSDNRVRTLRMVISSSTLNLVDHCDHPQYADGQEREQVQQQIPAAIARRSGLDRR